MGRVMNARAGAQTAGLTFCLTFVEQSVINDQLLFRSVELLESHNRGERRSASGWHGQQ